MADVSFTATAIKATSTTIFETAILGEAAITQGMILYKKASDTKWYKAHCETSADTAAAAGMALGAGGTDQRIQVAIGGDVTCDNLSLSAAAASGVYVLSASGAICPVDDIAADDYITFVGVASSATNLKLGFRASGVKAVA